MTRVPSAIGTAAHTAMKDTMFSVIGSRLPDYDPEELRPTVQTTGSGCIYNSNVWTTPPNSAVEQVEVVPEEPKVLPDWCAFVPSDPEC